MERMTMGNVSNMYPNVQLLTHYYMNMYPKSPFWVHIWFFAEPSYQSAYILFWYKDGKTR